MQRYLRDVTRAIRLWLAVTARAIRREARREPTPIPAPQTFGWADIELARRDFGVVVFGLLAVAALVASVPYTYQKVLSLHAFTEIGIAQSIGSLLVFEAGAFLAKVATLFIPGWRGRLNLTQAGLLLIVCAANYQTARAGAPTASALEIGVYVALMPLIQWLFLGLAVARAEALHDLRLSAQRTPTPAEQAHASFEAMRDRVWATFLERSLALMDEQTRALGALPAPQASYPRPEAQRTQPVLTLPEACPACGQAASAMQLRTAAQHGAYRCKGCGKRVSPQ